MADYQDPYSGNPEVVAIRTRAEDPAWAQGGFVPNDARNADKQEFDEFAGTPDSAFSYAVATYRAVKKREVDLAAERELAQHLSGGLAALGATTALLVEEARRIEADGSPEATDYPLLDELIPNQGADLAAVGTTIRAWWAGVASSVGAIEDVRRKAHDDIDAAGSTGAIDTVVSGVTWP